MQVKILKTDLSGLEQRLDRIADMLERLIETTDPIPKGWDPEKVKNRVTYTDENREIVAHKLHQMGRTYRAKK